MKDILDIEIGEAIYLYPKIGSYARLNNISMLYLTTSAFISNTMPLKICPGCKTKCGVRTLQCSECSFKFKIVKKDNKPFENKPFKKKKKRREPIEDWRSLSKGDLIKVPANKGSFYPTKREMIIVDKEGKKKRKEVDYHLDMSHHGTFEVVRVEQTGIVVVSVTGSNSSGFSFLYMGPEQISETGIHKKPHKIYLWKKKEQENALTEETTKTQDK